MSDIQWTSFDADVPSDWTEYDFEQFVRDHKWTFARTMPHNPHEYTLRKNTTDALFEAAVRFVREHGIMEQFAGKPYRVLHSGDYKYWTMGSPLPNTILINRKTLP